MENVTQISHNYEKLEFSWYDYILFLMMLLLSTLIGVYFGFIKKQVTSSDYLLGGREMSVFPISTSLIASMVSGITLLAIPTDVYNYGITYWFCVPMIFLSTLITYYVYIPVFYELKVTSIYEYLLQRFDSSVRTLASLTFTISIFTYLPIVIYIPALALSQSTDISVSYITPVICGICIFYTTFGGLKAVVWTDALQFFVMIGSVVVVFFLGISSTGGFTTIWQKNVDFQRLDVDFSTDVTKRDTFWASFIGLSITWFSYLSANQGYIQKCNALPNYKAIKRALIIFAIGMATILSASVFTGLIMFARYYNCDPLAAGKIKMADQLLPYYIMDVSKTVPGLPGLFTSGILSAALSTLSAVINCLSATIYEDFISQYVRKDTSEKTISNYLKLIAVGIGIISTLLVYVIPYLGNLLPLAISIGSATCGPLLGIFTSALLLPGINAKGAFWGGVTSLAVMAWTVLGSQYYKTTKVITYPILPVMTDGCRNSTLFDVTTLPPEIQNTISKEVPFILYRLSYYYYTLMGALIVIILGLIISKFTPQYNKTLSKKYFSPVIRNMLKNFDDPPDYDFLQQTDKEIKLNETLIK